MALTLEEIELTIVQLQEDLRRAKKARTLLLKKGKQDARLAEDLDKLLNKSSLDVLDTESNPSVEKRVDFPESDRSPLVETILSINEDNEGVFTLTDEEDEEEQREEEENIAKFF